MREPILQPKDQVVARRQLEVPGRFGADKDAFRLGTEAAHQIGCGSADEVRILQAARADEQTAGKD